MYYYSRHIPAATIFSAAKRIPATTTFAATLFAAALCAAALIPSCRRKPQPDSIYEIRIYSRAGAGFGYSLYQTGRIVIDQPNIPAIQHIVSFRSREEAENIAQLVKTKLQSGQFPPTVTIHDLDSLHVHYQ